MLLWVYYMYSYTIFSIEGYVGDNIYLHRRGAFALLVSTNRAMREPQWVGRVTGTGSHAFIIAIETSNAESRELIGNHRNTSGQVMKVQTKI